ncbi:hypothetical protein OTK59_12780 [Vibrio natriegens]|uniref:hypothetical protein n=1 Tax=Vibrio natriegens TaxID=691 RepID=UPI0008045492|nr:hypothetical protein [Vibrio natriegens]ANQ27548.1 hypothetical protein BA894_14435 [Vibrio natriegens]MCY9877425.1 hypothetical protein [Vibrio natriegens]
MKDQNKFLEVAEYVRQMSDDFNELASDKVDGDIYTEIIDFRRTLTKESDRAAALMSAAYLDEQLKLLLAANLGDDPKVKARFLGTGGVIDSFSARIDLAYLLGLIPHNIRYDLELIRRIRNDFAHTASQMNFETDSVKSRCYLFKTPIAVEHLDAHGRFLRVSVVCACQIGNQIKSSDQIKIMPDYDDTPSEIPMKAFNEHIKEKFGIDLLELASTINEEKKQRRQNNK